MKNKKPLIGVLVVVAVAAFWLMRDKEVQPTREGIENVSASGGIGEEIKLGGVTIVPTKVLEDSRCPANANCIWMGTVKVRASVEGKTETVLELNKEVVIDGVSTTLTEVLPQSQMGVKIGDADYRFKFQINGN